MAKQSLPQNSEGFTLLEVIIAITIFAIAISLVYTLYDAVTSIVISVEDQSRRDLAAKIILDRISEDLASVYVDKEGYLTVQQPAGFSEEDPLLAAVTAAHLQLQPEADPADVALVNYYLKKRSDSDIYRLLRSDTPVVVDSQVNVLPEKQKHLLSDEVVKLEIIVIGHDDEEYGEWNSAEDFDDEQDIYVRFPKAYIINLSLGVDAEDDSATSYRKRVTGLKKLIEFEEE